MNWEKVVNKLRQYGAILDEQAKAPNPDKLVSLKADILTLLAACLDAGLEEEGHENVCGDCGIGAGEHAPDCPRIT